MKYFFKRISLLVFIYYYWFLVIISNRSEILEFRTIPAFSEMISTSLTLTRVSVYPAVSFESKRKYLLLLISFSFFLYFFSPFTNQLFFPIFLNSTFSKFPNNPTYFPIKSHSLSLSPMAGQVARWGTPCPLPFCTKPLSSILIPPPSQNPNLI